VKALDELIALLEPDVGFYLEPVLKGQPLGGIGDNYHAEFDGWMLGLMYGIGGEEIAVGRTIEEAVTAAVKVLRNQKTHA
jgi:hypothetical protein